MSKENNENAEKAVVMGRIIAVASGGGAAGAAVAVAAAIPLAIPMIIGAGVCLITVGIIKLVKKDYN